MRKLKPSEVGRALTLIRTLSQATYLANAIPVPEFDMQHDDVGVYGPAYKALVKACIATLAGCGLDYVEAEEAGRQWVTNIIDSTSGWLDRSEVRRQAPVELPSTAVEALEGETTEWVDEHTNTEAAADSKRLTQLNHIRNILELSLEYYTEGGVREAIKE